MAPEMQSYIIEAIVSLLKEAQPYNFEKSSESNDRLTRAGLWLCGDIDSIYSVQLEERRLLSRYGVWLLSALCKPVAQAPKPIIGRLIGALFHWFDTTALVTDGKSSIFSLIAVYSRAGRTFPPWRAAFGPRESKRAAFGPHGPRITS